VLEKESSNGSKKSKLSASTEILSETESIARCPM
jgi:hypothetical protein